MLRKVVIVTLSVLLIVSCSIFRARDVSLDFMNNIYPKSWSKRNGSRLLKMLQFQEERSIKEYQNDNNRLVNIYHIEDNLNEFNWHLLLEPINEDIGKSHTEMLRLSQNAEYMSSFMRENDYSRLMIKHLKSGEQIEFSAGVSPHHITDALSNTMPVTAWAPYGNCLAYTNWDEQYSGLYLILVKYDEDLLYFEYSYFCLDENRNYTYVQPAWSADGKYLACTRFKENNFADILILDLQNNRKTILNQYENMHSLEFSEFNSNNAVLSVRLAPELYKLAVVKNIFRNPEIVFCDNIISESGFIRAAVSSNGKRIAAVYENQKGILQLQILYNNKNLELQQEISVSGNLNITSRHYPVSTPFWIWNDNYLIFADYLGVYYFFVNEQQLNTNAIIKNTIKGGFDYKNIHSLNYCPVQDQVIFTAQIESINNQDMNSFFLSSKIIKEPVISTIDMVVFNSICMQRDGDNIILKADDLPLGTIPPGANIAGYTIIRDKKPLLYLDYKYVDNLMPGDEIICQWDTKIRNPQRGVKMKYEIVELSREIDTKKNN